jgi:predicted metal-binding protein
VISEIRFNKPEHHLFICVNNRAEKGDFSKPSCGPLITKEQVKDIKQWILSQGYSQKIWVTATHCLGFCNAEGGVVAKFPEGQFSQGFQNATEIKEYIVKICK